MPIKEIRQQQEVKSWTDAEKAAAVARVLAGESVHGVAKALGVSTSTVRLWRAKGGFDPDATRSDPETNGPDYRGLILRHMELGLAAAERILAQTQDAVWLGKQSAGELAVFYGVVFDKIARVASALPAGRDAEPDAVDAPPRLVDASRGADPTSVEYRPG